MRVAVASVKGSPGVTTTAVALAAVWPAAAGTGAAGVVVEADCAGGDLGGRCWLPDAPGLASLAAGRRTHWVSVEDHLTRLPCGVDAVLAPAGRHAATVATGLLAESGLGWVDRATVVVDVGRLEPGTPAAVLAGDADAVLVCSRGDEASLLHLTDAGVPRDRAGLVLVGPSRYTGQEIADAVGLPVLACLPWDTAAAEVIWGRRRPRKGWTRRGLPAAARALAAHLTDHQADHPDESREATPPTAPTTEPASDRSAALGGRR